MGLDRPAQMRAGDGNWYDMPIAIIPIGDVTYRIMRHPEVLRMKHISDFAEDYHYTEHYKIPVPFEERHSCWIEARNIYNYYYTGVSEWQIKIQSNKS